MQDMKNTGSTEDMETSLFDKIFAAAFRPASLKIIVKSLLITALVFFALYLLLLIVLLSVGVWLLSLLGFLGAWGIWLIIVVSAIYLFPLVFTAVILFYLEDLINLNTDIDFPNLPRRRENRIRESVAGAVKFFLVLVGLNLVALPLAFVVGIIIPLFGFVLVYLPLNGYLIAREYHSLIAARYLDAEAVKDDWQKHKAALFALGCATYVMLLLPLINLFAPYVCVLAMLYVWHQRRGDLTLLIENK